MRPAAALRAWLPQGGVARRLAFLTLVQSAGSGLFLTSSAVFFVRVVGLRPGQVGLGLSLAGLAGFLSTVPVGRLADRYGARRLLALDYAALALLFGLYPLVRDFTAFVVVAGLISIGEIAGSPLRSALIHAAVPAAEAVRTRAILRTAFNAGFMSGAAVAGLAVATASFPVFCVVCAGNALAQAGCVVIVLRLRVLPGLDGGRPAPRLGSALRDIRFLFLTLGNGLLELHTTVIIVGTPLWIISHTSAPAGLASVVVITNTVIVLLFQVRLSRGADTPAGAARLQRRAGLLLAAGCVLCASSQGVNSVRGAVVVILAGTAVLSLGEIVQAAGGWGLSFELPPPGRQGEYQGVFALGRGVQQFVGPVLVTSLLVGVGAAGWLVLAALFVAVGLICVPLVTGSRRWARDEPALSQ